MIFGCKTLLFDFSERQLSLSGRASTSPGVRLDYMNQPDENRGVNGTFFLNGTQYFMNFYSTRLPPEPGLRIAYCAGMRVG